MLLTALADSYSCTKASFIVCAQSSLSTFTNPLLESIGSIMPHHYTLAGVKVFLDLRIPGRILLSVSRLKAV